MVVRKAKRRSDLPLLVRWLVLLEGRSNGKLYDVRYGPDQAVTSSGKEGRSVTITNRLDHEEDVERSMSIAISPKHQPSEARVTSTPRSLGTSKGGLLAVTPKTH